MGCATVIMDMSSAARARAFSCTKIGRLTVHVRDGCGRCASWAMQRPRLRKGRLCQPSPARHEDVDVSVQALRV